MDIETVTHTPAPWTIHRQLEGSTSKKPLSLIRGQHPDMDGSDLVVAANIRDRDARLIAVAPELLAAAQRFMDNLDSGKDWNEWEAAKSDIRAAIAKATGQ